MAGDFQVVGANSKALFTLKAHRGDGMLLLAMNWKKGTPPEDFVGFAIEYKEPKGERFFALKNRLGFLGKDGKIDPEKLSTRLSPIQKFRWVHFPRNAELDGEFIYRVSAVFMNTIDELSYGEPQEVAIALARETYPGLLNVCFTRGFVSSQAFVDKYVTATDGMDSLIPVSGPAGLKFEPTHPKAQEALEWMGFEARSAILEVLDAAIEDRQAQVRVVAYDLNVPDVVRRLEQLGARLQIIIDDSKDHKKPGSAENQAEKRLKASAGSANVKRQHMANLQHNKTIVVDGPKVQAVVCGSTNYTWRGLFVQNNNAVILRSKNATKIFRAAFESYWNSDKAADFGRSAPAKWVDLKLKGIDAQVAFSPHSASNALLEKIGRDIKQKTTSCLFYSLAFLAQTKGAIRDAVKAVTEDKAIFVYGMADRRIGGLTLQLPDGNAAPVYPAELKKSPPPFRPEPDALSGGVGTRMHHKFVVIDFDKPTARVYLGSYNFSRPADVENGENLLLIRDRRIAVSYAIEALRIFDHYHFRIAQRNAKDAHHKLCLKRPPRNAGEQPWWKEDYTNGRKKRDRELFA
jgi:hypothetical protein